MLLIDTDTQMTQHESHFFHRHKAYVNTSQLAMSLLARPVVCRNVLGHTY